MDSKSLRLFSISSLPVKPFLTAKSPQALANFMSLVSKAWSQAFLIAVLPVIFGSRELQAPYFPNFSDKISPPAWFALWSPPIPSRPPDRKTFARPHRTISMIPIQTSNISAPLLPLFSPAPGNLLWLKLHLSLPPYLLFLFSQLSLWEYIFGQGWTFSPIFARFQTTDKLFPRERFRGLAANIHIHSRVFHFGDDRFPSRATASLSS